MASNSKDTFNEFSLIEELFAPLATDQGAFGLLDDAASLTPKAGHDVVITKDALVAGVHFFETDPAHKIAQKLLRVNLSDLAAKGARPIGYFLSCAWPQDITLEWIKDFVRGLKADQDEFGLSLLGGDTLRTPGPLTFSLTAIGEVPSGQMIKRSGAKAGDLVYVSGTIGDAGLGLRLLQVDPSLSTQAGENALIDRYLLPRPRQDLGHALQGLATACLDVSDGLIADASHLAKASQGSLHIELDKVPLSPGAKVMEIDVSELVTYGDDYELLFTIPAETETKIKALEEFFGLKLTCIGKVQQGQGVEVVDSRGKSVALSQTGYQHF